MSTPLNQFYLCVCAFACVPVSQNLILTEPWSWADINRTWNIFLEGLLGKYWQRRHGINDQFFFMTTSWWQHLSPIKLNARSKNSPESYSNYTPLKLEIKISLTSITRVFNINYKGVCKHMIGLFIHCVLKPFKKTLCYLWVRKPLTIKRSHLTFTLFTFQENWRIIESCCDKICLNN